MSPKFSKPRLTDEMKLRIVDAYHDGLSVKQIMDIEGVGQYQVYRVFREFDLKVVRRSGEPGIAGTSLLERFTADELDRIVEEYVDELSSVEDIARRWGFSTAGVYAIMRTLGVPTRQQTFATGARPAFAVMIDWERRLDAMATIYMSPTKAAVNVPRKAGIAYNSVRQWMWKNKMPAPADMSTYGWYMLRKKLGRDPTFKELQDVKVFIDKLRAGEILD